MWAVLVVCVAVTIVLVRCALLSCRFRRLLAVPARVLDARMIGAAHRLRPVRHLVAAQCAREHSIPSKRCCRAWGRLCSLPMFCRACCLPSACSSATGGTACWRSSARSSAPLWSYYYARSTRGASISGLYGFNGVSAAIAVFVVLRRQAQAFNIGGAGRHHDDAGDLRPRHANGVRAPFVFATWLMLALGWVEDKWFDVKEEAAAPAASGSETIAPAQTLMAHRRD